MSETTTINPLLFFVAMIPFGLLLVAFFVYMDKRLPVPNVPSSKTAPPMPAVEKAIEKAEDHAGNREPAHHAPPAAPAAPDIMTLSAGRQLKVLRAIERAYKAGFSPEDIDRLLNAHSRRTSPPVAAQARALLAKQIPAGVVADLLGGTRGDILAWLKEIAADGAPVPGPSEAVEPKEEQPV